MAKSVRARILREDVLAHRPRDGKTVARAGAPSDLVHDDEAAGCRAAQDVCRLVHLDEERRFAPGEVVRGPDPAEDAVDDPDLCPGSGHEGAHLRHQDYQGDLPEEGGLPRHVRPRDDHEEAPVSRAGNAVGHERPAGKVGLHDRVPAFLDGELAAVRHLRPRIPVDGRGECEGLEHVELGDRFTDPEQPRHSLLDDGAHAEEEVLFDLDDLLRCVVDLRLQVGQPIGGVALSPDQGLAADEVRPVRGRDSTS